MEFLTPLMLVGAAGVAVPIAIHLIGRRRAKVVRFAALDFLMGSRRKVARRLQLRELILLITRALVCLAIPLALAKPYTSCATHGPQVERGPQAAVLVIDNSFASRYDFGDETLIDRARSQAYAVLDQLGPEADVAILLSAERADGPSELSRDHIRLRDTIRDIEATARPADTTTALRRAAQLLAASNHERRTIYLFSPLAATGLRPDDPPWPPGAGPGLTIVPLADGASLDNLAVTNVEVAPDPSSGSRGIRVTVEIANFGSLPVDELGVSLRIGDDEVARGLISLLAGERQKKRFLAVLPGTGRAADIVVGIDHDRLSVDDERFVRAELRDEVRVLLVNGDPHTNRHESEVFYLEAALRPGDRGDSGVAVTTTTVDALAQFPLGGFDVVILANVRALDGARVTELSEWVRAGGGLMLTMGDHVDPDTYNRVMSPLLPQSLNTALDTAYGSRGAERSGRAQRLVKFEVDHPIFAVFSKDAPGLREASFGKIMLLGPTSKVDDRRVLARYTNGAAALVEARSGKGRLLLYASSADRDWNDLAIFPGYLPMMQQAVRHLARKQTQLGRDSVLVGRGAVIPVSPDDTRLEIRGPRSTNAVIEGDRLEGRKQVRFSETRSPGFYRVHATDRADRRRLRDEASFAVNLDPRGSDLRPAPPSILPAPGTGTGNSGPSQHRRKVELWHALAAGLLLLLVVESVLVARS